MLTIRILGLTALALLSVVPLVKPIPPALHTQGFSRVIPFTTATLSGCGATLYTASFQDNVTGRDVGSTIISFVSPLFTPNTLAHANVSLATLFTNYCTVGPVPYIVAIGNDMAIRPLASGNYTLSDHEGYDFSTTFFKLTESWTVTTIS